jgi:hypothetical protein
MSARVTVAVDDGGAVAIKTATTPDEIAVLAVEAERLRQARHPGVVVLLDHRRTVDGAELLTRFAGEPIDRWQGPLVSLAGLVAAVAADLGDLHDIGVVHGRIDGSHVLVGANGRPRLCGFSTPPGEPIPADDVAALALLLGELVERTVSAERRTSLLWRRGPVADHKAVAQIVARATDPVPTRRPNARNLANAILAAIPGAELPPPEPPARPVDDHRFDAVFGDQTEAAVEDVFGDRPWSPPPIDITLERPQPTGARRVAHRAPEHRSLARVTLTTGLVGVALVALGAVVVRGGGAGAGAGARRSTPDTTLATALVPPDVEIDHGVVQMAGERWRVGEPDDLVAVGDWDCDGVATPAAYRPGTGDVFVFSDWATDGRPLTVDAIAQVPGGRSLTTAPGRGPGGCDAPIVELPSGRKQVIEVHP